MRLHRRLAIALGTTIGIAALTTALAGPALASAQSIGPGGLIGVSATATGPTEVAADEAAVADIFDNYIGCQLEVLSPQQLSNGTWQSFAGAECEARR